MIQVLIQVILSLFNLANSRVDAYLILKNKTVAHGINFSAYLLFSAGMAYLFGVRGSCLILYFATCFFNRQITFDVSLNVRRFGWKGWDYSSVANPPKAFMDRIERAIKKLVSRAIKHEFSEADLFGFYFCMWVFLTILLTLK